MITFTKNELKHVEVYSIRSYVIKIISRTDRHDVLLKMALNKQYAILSWVQMNFIFNDNVRILCLSCNVKKSKNLSDLNKKERNKRHSSPFINVVKGVFSGSHLLIYHSGLTV
jgi:hypothetical protein